MINDLYNDKILKLSSNISRNGRLENFDFTLMNTLLQNMSDGMKVALYTTLTGLVTSILLSMQYKYLEALVYKIFHICNTCIPFFDDELKKIYEDEKKIF